MTSKKSFSPSHFVGERSAWSSAFSLANKRRDFFIFSRLTPAANWRDSDSCSRAKIYSTQRSLWCMPSTQTQFLPQFLFTGRRKDLFISTSRLDFYYSLHVCFGRFPLWRKSELVRKHEISAMKVFLRVWRSLLLPFSLYYSGNNDTVICYSRLIFFPSVLALFQEKNTRTKP